MVKVIVTKEMLEKDYDELTVEEETILNDVLFDMFKYNLDYSLYYNHIDLKIIDTDGLTVQIESINDYVNHDVNLSYDFGIEYGTLLSLCTDLDYAFYNSDIELWNTICKDENLINHRNVNDIYSESIFLLFSEIEEMIYNKSELLSDDEISYIVDDYKYKDLVDCDKLYNYICLSMNELDKWINNRLNEYFLDDIDEMFIDSQFENSKYLYEQVVVQNDGVMEYIL